MTAYINGQKVTKIYQGGILYTHLYVDGYDYLAAPKVHLVQFGWANFSSYSSEQDEPASWSNIDSGASITAPQSGYELYLRSTAADGTAVTDIVDGTGVDIKKTGNFGYGLGRASQYDSTPIVGTYTITFSDSTTATVQSHINAMTATLNQIGVTGSQSGTTGTNDGGAIKSKNGITLQYGFVAEDTDPAPAYKNIVSDDATTISPSNKLLVFSKDIVEGGSLTGMTDNDGNVVGIEGPGYYVVFDTTTTSAAYGFVLSDGEHIYLKFTKNSDGSVTVEPNKG